VRRHARGEGVARAGRRCTGEDAPRSRPRRVRVRDVNNDGTVTVFSGGAAVPDQDGPSERKKLKVRRYSAIMILPTIFQILLDLTPAVCRPKGKHWGS
jgi:hypothetical protein